MSSSRSRPISVEHLAEEFLDRLRRGENPSVAEYARRHPELAGEIRDFFPALRLVEAFKPDSRDDPAVTKRGGPARLAPQSLPAVPRRLGDFQILREVARGGMGVVYEAVQESLGRPVALKVLPPHALPDARQKKRFVREARSAARLHHTNIVPVFGVGETDGVHYYAMQFINGLGLDDVLDELRRGRHEVPANAPLGDRDGAVVAGKPAASARRGSTGGDRSVTAVFVVQSLVSGCFARDRLLHESGSDSIDSDSVNLPVPATDTTANGLSDTATYALPGQDASASGSGTTLCKYWQSVARIGVQVADALEYAHDHGVLHRDVKPSNLLLDSGGTAWVTDFGLAKADDEDDLTRTGDVVGTLRYMAPELFQGKADARSDVYSLGLTLYELLAMQPAFDETNRHQLVRQVLHHSPARLRTLNRHIPRDLETIVEKAIDRDPGRRYQGAGDLADDLRRFLGDEPIRARRISYTARCVRWCRRNPGMALSAAALTLLLLVVGVGGACWAIHAESARQRIASAEHDATRRLLESYLAQADASRWSGRPGQRIKSLEAVRQAAALIPRLRLGGDTRRKLRNDAIAAMGLIDLDEGEQFKLPKRDWWVTFDEQMRHYACADTADDLLIRRLSDHRPISRTGILSPPTNMVPRRFTSDGRYLVGCDGGHGWVWDVAREETVLKFETESSVHADVSVSCQRDTLAVIAPRGAVRILHIPTGKHVQTLPTDAKVVSLSADASLAAVACGPKNRGLQIWDSATGRLLRTLDIPRVQSIAWCPDDRLLACSVEGDYRIGVWNVQTGERCAELAGHQNRGLHLSFSDDGSVLASSSWDGTARLWDPIGGRELMRADGHRCEFRAGGSLMLTSAVEVHLWRLVGSAECKTFRAADDRSDIFTDCDFWWGGPLVACARDDGLRIWDLQANREVAFAPIGQTDSVLFHRDSESLITLGTVGVYQWPVSVSDGSFQLRLGPPRKLCDTMVGQAGESKLAQSPDGDRLAAVLDHDTAVSFTFDDSESRTELDGHADISSLSVSGDGRWVASGTRFGKGIRIWNAETGRQMHDLWPECTSGTVMFSPVGNVLAAWDDGEMRIFETRGWKLARRFTGQSIGHGMAWSTDGRWLAHSANNQARLVDATSGAELATVTSPNEAGNIQSLCLSPTNGRLAVVYRNAIEVWDLRRLRRRLAEMDLDWDLPPLSPEPPSHPLPKSVDFDLGVFATSTNSMEKARLHTLNAEWMASAQAFQHAVQSAASPVHHELGNADRCDRYWTKATEWLDNPRTLHAHDRWAVKLLSDEARELLSRLPSPGPPSGN